MVARIHVWRGETTSAALELLRALVEADASGDRVDMAAAIAEFGRLNLETGRYEAALELARTPPVEAELAALRDE